VQNHQAAKLNGFTVIEKWGNWDRLQQPTDSLASSTIYQILSGHQVS